MYRWHPNQISQNETKAKHTHTHIHTTHSTRRTASSRIIQFCLSFEFTVATKAVALCANAIKLIFVFTHKIIHFYSFRLPLRVNFSIAFCNFHFLNSKGNKIIVKFCEKVFSWFPSNRPRRPSDAKKIIQEIQSIIDLM